MHLLKIYDTLVKGITFLLFGPNKGTRVLHEEWNHLIILDACRYDFFEKLYKQERLPGKLEWRTSRGSTTIEFLLKNFTEDEETLKDIVYVTANPYVSMLLQGKVGKIIHVWKYFWDEEQNTVLPQPVYYSALEAYQKYPNRRLIVHFLQPHFPYIGYKLAEAGKIAENSRRDAIGQSFTIKRGIGPTIQTLLKAIIERKLYILPFYAKLDRATHVKMYLQNLKKALPYAVRLAILLPQKSIITADHGEAFGEFLHKRLHIEVYGHMTGVRIESLVKVPWMIIDEEDKPDKEEREKIIREELKKWEKEKIRLKIKKLFR